MLLDPDLHLVLFLDALEGTTNVVIVSGPVDPPFARGIVHAENLGTDMARAGTGRYYVAAFIRKGMELASCRGRFVAFREAG